MNETVAARIVALDARWAAEDADPQAIAAREAQLARIRRGGGHYNDEAHADIATGLDALAATIENVRPARWIEGDTIVEEGTGRTWPNTPDMRHALGPKIRPGGQAFTMADECGPRFAVEVDR